MGKNDYDVRLREIARQTKEALGDSAKVEVCRSDTTYRVWEEFHKKYPMLKRPSDGTKESREFSYIPSDEVVAAKYAASERGATAASEEQKDENPKAKPSGASEQAKSPATTPSGPYAGENKAAASANWADLNNNNFEVIDEPDENGNIPTRPIHGKVTVDGEAKNGENPAKFTITDSDNGGVYTFELDTTAEGKVVYRCTSGPGGAYSKGNDYELRTINGKSMLVQMKNSEGYGVGIANANPAVQEEESPAADDEAQKTEMTPEERSAKIKEEAAAVIKSDYTPTTDAEKTALKNLQEEKTLFELANTNLATAAYAEEKLEVTKDNENKQESATLPNGQKITITRDEDGKIKEVKIQANEAGHTVTYNKENSIGYARLGNIPNTMYDWNKVLELAIRIFGETAATE